MGQDDNELARRFVEAYQKMPPEKFGKWIKELGLSFLPMPPKFVQVLLEPGMRALAEPKMDEEALGGAVLAAGSYALGAAYYSQNISSAADVGLGAVSFAYAAPLSDLSPMVNVQPAPGTTCEVIDQHVGGFTIAVSDANTREPIDAPFKFIVMGANLEDMA